MLLEMKMEERWELLIQNQGKEYVTTKGLPFTYQIRNFEIFIDRKKKSITKSSVWMAYQEVLKLGGVVSGPKKLGVFGASYLYPVFLKIGITRGKC